MEAVGGFRNILSISAVVFNEIDFKLGELCCAASSVRQSNLPSGEPPTEFDVRSFDITEGVESLRHLVSPMPHPRFQWRDSRCQSGGYALIVLAIRGDRLHM
jgi:hypothetical protein